MVAGVVVGSLLLAACGDGRGDAALSADGTTRTRPSVSRSDDRAAPTSPPASVPTSVPSVTLPDDLRVGEGEGGPGTITLHVTEPITFSGHVEEPVTCEVSGSRYGVSIDSAEFQGHQLGVDVAVTTYRGPGDYRATVAVELVTPQETTTATVPGVPVTIASADQGWFDLTFTSDTGESYAFSLAWYCSA